MEKVVKKICLDSDILIGVSKHEDKSIAALASLDAVFYTTSHRLMFLKSGREKRKGKNFHNF